MTSEQPYDWQVHGERLPRSGPAGYGGADDDFRVYGDPHLLADAINRNYPLDVGNHEEYGVRAYHPRLLKYGGRDPYMIIPPDWLQSVAFLCQDDPERGRRAEGTAFFVQLGGKAMPGEFWHYLVTSRHLIEDSKAGPIYIRLGKPEDDIPTLASDWTCHESLDIAVISARQFLIGRQTSFRSLPTDIFVDSDYQYRGPPLEGSEHSLQVHVGHELAFLGLFVKRPGEAIPLPVARFGRLAAMPTEPITLQRYRRNPPPPGEDPYFETLAYLAECRSWGGHSGSPVFWYYPMTSTTIVDGHEVIVIGNAVGLMGLVSGHFDMDAPNGTVLDAHEVMINSGIAAVTPIAGVMEILMNDKGFIKDREEGRRRRRAENAATADSAPDEEPSLTKADFESALRRVSRRRPTSSEPGPLESET